MNKALYSARVGESISVGEALAYDTLLLRIMEFTVRGAIARSMDEDEWEQEALRRNGLAALQIFRNGRAVWTDRASFNEQLSEAKRENVDRRFCDNNELDTTLYARMDRDLRNRWRAAGYETPSLLTNMKKLFAELERDLADRAAGAREHLVDEILSLN